MTATRTDAVRATPGPTTGRIRSTALVGAVVLALLTLVAVLASAAQAAPPRSDDFNRCDAPGGPWTLVDPVGDAVVSTSGAGTADARLALAIPGGVSHDPWHQNRSARIMQPVDNADLGLEVKFDSRVGSRFQMQGLIVEQDAGNWLRFEVHHDGKYVRAFAARTVNGVSTGVVNTRILSSASVRLRVARVGDAWTFAYSYDGATFVTAGTFTHALAVSAVGPFAGNHGAVGSIPAHTALIDYFESTADPIVAEDGGTPTGTGALDLTVEGAGAVTREPALSAYPCGSDVVLQATPEAGSSFAGYAGDLTGVANPASLRIDATTKRVTARFVPDVAITGVAVAPADTSATITWTTNIPSDSAVSHGRTASYELGVARDPALVTAHSVTLAGLDSGTPYHFRVRSAAAEGAPAQSADLTFTTTGAPPNNNPGIVSDDFNRCVAPGGPWTFVDPVSDASVYTVGAGTPDARLGIALPAGSAHDPFNTNRSARIVQPSANTDLGLEVRFTSTVTKRFQVQGLLIEQDAGNWLRFDLHHDGSGIRAYAASTVNGTSTARINASAPAGTQFLRVIRLGDHWVLSHSADGLTWTEAGAVTHMLAVTSVGILAGNSASTGTAPAHAAEVDYFQSSAAPLAGEDTGAPTGTVAVEVAVEGQGTVTQEPALAAHPCGSDVTLTGAPAAGWAFAGFTGDLTSATSPAVLRADASRKRVVARFIESLAVSGVAVAPTDTSAAVSWTTNLPASSRVDYGLTSTFGQNAASGTAVTAHSLTLTGLTPGTLYHYRATSTGADGTTARSEDLTFTTTGQAPAPAEIVSDDFNRCVAPGGPWTLVDPVGDATVYTVGAGTADARLGIALPAGSAHDPFNANRSARIVQPAPDSDVTLEVKFTSAVTQRFQIQGLLVEQDAGNWLRFDFHHDGLGVRSFAASTVNGVSSARVNVGIAAGTPLFMRVARVGDTWTQSHSRDGQTWTVAGSFTHTLRVGTVGILAGNSNSAGAVPAHAAEVDFFQTSTAPLASEDGGAPTGAAPLALAIDGSGTVARNPELTSYPCGSDVTLDAVPSTGWAFEGFSGDVATTATPATLRVNSSRPTVRAGFTPEAPGPVLTGISATPTDTGATVTWTTDVPADSLVEYGRTTAYTGGSVSAAGLVTAHSLQIGGLEPGTLYHYRVRSANSVGAATVSPDLTFTTTGALPDPTGLTSDDFNAANLDTSRWTLTDPIGDARLSLLGTGTDEARVAIALPAGSAHDPFHTNRGVRILQPANDTDLQLEVKFLSPITKRFQIQGLLIEQDPGNWLRFDLHSDGSSVRAYAASTVNGRSTTRSNVAIGPAPAPAYLRVSRVGDTWTQSYSSDGQTWTQAASFSHALTVTAAGILAGNSNSSGAVPAHTVEADYFLNTAAPFAAEDGSPAADTRPPLLHAVQTAGGADSVQLDFATDELATAEVAYGTTTAYQGGTVTQDALRRDHAVTVTGLTPQTTYHFRITARDAGGRVSSSGDIVQATVTASAVPEIDVWYGDTQSFGHLGRAQTHANILGNVSDPDGIASLSYTLNGGSPQPLSRGPDKRRLALPGDFATEIPFSALTPGANSVVLRAEDTLGNAAVRTVTLNYTTGRTWPLPFTIDWSAVSSLEQVGQVIDGLWTFDATGVRPVVLDYDRLIGIGDLAWTDYEITVPVTVRSIDHAGGDAQPSFGPLVGLGLRWQGHTAVDATQPRWGFYPVGAFAWYRWEPDGNEEYQFRTEGVPTRVSRGPLELNRPYMFKFRVTTQANGRGLYQFRSWPQDQPEPTTWRFSVEGVQDLPSGSALLIAHHADVTFGNVSIVPL